MRAHVASVVVVAALAFAGCNGCGALFGGDALVVRRVLVDVDPAAVAAGVDRERVRAEVSDVLAHSRGVVVDDKRGDGAVLRVRVESFARAAFEPAADPNAATAPPLPKEAKTQTETPPSTLSLAVDVTEGGRPTLRGHSVASAHGVVDPHALVEQALRDAVAQALQTRAADQLSSDELLSWLTSETASSEQKQRAMQALGSRREKKATPTLVAILQGGDEELQAQALQAITLLADEDAVDAVIVWSDRQPALMRKLAIDAVKASAHGGEAGKRGMAWLFTLSTGHPDVDVQAHARAALQSLESAQPPPRVAETTSSGG